MKEVNKFNKIEILKFLVGGGSAVVTDFIAYKLLMNFGMDRNSAKTISFI